ncbi:MAG: hypothetical protein JRJ38_17565 [Deltaproteobacteria bacterium]|nr:hypothetical protein [Deltaproteobacteria bacterium]
MNDMLKHFISLSPKIARLPNSSPLSKEDLLIEVFRLWRDNALEIYYAPADYVNKDAQVAIIGITPGWHQMEIAYRTARDAIRRGLTPAQVCKQAKQKASFAGTMRVNLIKMLDSIGIPAALGLESSESLFENASGMLHTTSAVRYPVFVDGENYTGHKPDLLKTSRLRQYVDTLLVEELEKAKRGFIIPLGRTVSSVLEYLITTGRVEEERCCLGFPHPSGANAHRRRQFDERRKAMRRKVTLWFR